MIFPCKHHKRFMKTCVFTILVSNDSTLHDGNGAEWRYHGFCTKRSNPARPAGGLLSFSTGQTGALLSGYSFVTLPFCGSFELLFLPPWLDTVAFVF